MELVCDVCVDLRFGLVVFIDCWILDFLIWRFVMDVSVFYDKF